MKRLNFYWCTFLIGFVCAGFVLYGHRIINSAMEPPSSNQASASSVFPSPDQTAYLMRLYLDPATRTIYGETILTTSNTSEQALSELWFTVYPNAFGQPSDTPAPPEAYYSGFNPGWLELEKVEINGHKADYARQGVSLQVWLPHDFMPGSKLEVTMKWKTRVPRVAYRFGTRDGVYMLGNFYPVLNVYDYYGWHNSYNSVFGDPFCFHSADYLVELNIPEYYSMVSSGQSSAPIIEDNGRQTFVIRAQNARDFSLALMYDYSELQKTINKTSLRCYAPKGNEDTCNAVLEQSGLMMNYYNCTLGTYPYSEFKVVFVPMKGFHGMEYSGMIFLSQDFLDGSWPSQKSEFVLAHEIAHQWWYGMVGNDQVKEPWLDEGLANWCAYKYLNEVRNISLPAQTAREGVNLGRELCEMYSRQDYYMTAYTGGEAFWFGLEKELGENEVKDVLRRYLAEYRYKIASSHDLLKIIRQEAHKDMEKYFYQWFQVDP